MKFEGFDFTELLDVLMPDFEGTEEEHLKLFRETLNAFHLEEERPKATWVPIMREWLAVFVEGDDYAMPLYQGLRKIEDDWTFAKYFTILIEYMWT